MKSDVSGLCPAREESWRKSYGEGVQQEESHKSSPSSKSGKMKMNQFLPSSGRKSKEVLRGRSPTGRKSRQVQVLWSIISLIKFHISGLQLRGPYEFTIKGTIRGASLHNMQPSTSGTGIAFYHRQEEESRHQRTIRGARRKSTGRKSKVLVVKLDVPCQCEARC